MALLFGDERATKAVLSFFRKANVGQMVKEWKTLGVLVDNDCEDNCEDSNSDSSCPGKD